MNLTVIHGYLLGFAIIGSWAIIGFWSLALRFTRYDETPTFWRAVSVAQLLLALQLIVGLVLFALGGRPGDDADNAGGLSLLFHVLYGVVFPLIVLVVAHGVAREGRYNPHGVFALVGLVIFGLTARGWGVGIGGF
jgi:hypothetical protein